jgi:pimeloyl-ACP methyl ester carboxylesterase
MPWHETPADLARARAERPFVVPASTGRLFGVLTPPALEVPSAELCVVLLTRPRSHRNRMWIEGARRLAARGFSTIRVDYHGCGDSGGASAPLDPNRPYRDDAVAVIRHARQQFGMQRFVVCGACFDARTALSAFAQEGGCIVGLVFMAAPVMELDTVVQAHADTKNWAHLWRALFKLENWRALGQRGRWKHMTTVVDRVSRRSMGGAQDELPLSAGFVDDFRALVRSRARALFLYGVEDAEYASFRVAERKLFATLPPNVRARFDVEVWPGSVHGFLEKARQRETFARAVSWIEALHPSTLSASAPADRAGLPAVT